MKKTLSLGILALGLLLILPLGKLGNAEVDPLAFEWHGLVCPTVERVDGSIEVLECSSNAITTEGKNHIRYSIGKAAGGNAAFDYLAIGNGTATSVSDTTLASEQTACGLARAQGTYTADAVAGNWSIQYQWTTSCDGGIVINTTGLFNASSAGATDTLLADADLSNSVTLQDGDKLNITYYTWVA